ncbi:tRNA (adenosine(37)-N6)-dimethylallyltransferase MiaA [Coprobacter fastidiosus]|uniref:tRNA dimethylallyltransferase n=4 Tax=Coprobacter fastidiosus TaxID=1099853 RepID=A0A495WJP1_9BACT|nr:tRNA (adenosine(37)-N6)-dimethylallyltransferase MiaA [Coprobacter fastidiosus]EHL88251.1 tRNA dimethylallyltransferase [Tannerella sp. 6_1_58FAA_CT1]ERM90027.1 tRNA delta(2)-isopentenylpyrophosphate transferase [Coprobacter fastidiosus NSB1 = JCM 33896]RKT61324.1 tRNA dimethylallyltransferase [Coprobacter fastidiosus NSB1 = JCM 33896]BEG61395.1 tRNA (adenosine(37)-N6)-dimethylallyltransferase MiaA [Coprobacter fastidiosus]
MKYMFDLITILGPTASGKTSLAVALAADLNTEIISADSRQIYKRMDIGTGKDLEEYKYEDKEIPYHLIDICEPGYKYNLYEYQRDFNVVFQDLRTREKFPILCGGTGLYIETVLKGYSMPQVPENKELREKLKDKTLTELTSILKTYKTLHNTTDVDSCKRAVRAIEIAEFYRNQQPEERKNKPLNSFIVGVDIEREARRRKISERLQMRLDSGMVDEVRALLKEGISPDDLIYYGLEYKYLTEYLIGRLSYVEMVSKLEIAIHQFAKRQMTWFRGMERRGFSIFWLDAFLPLDEKIMKIKEQLKK